MSLTTVSMVQLMDWVSNIPGRLEQFIGCDFFHETEGWLTLVELDETYMTMKDQQGDTGDYARLHFEEYIIEVKVPTDSEVVTSYKDISALGHLSRKFDLPYRGLVQAHANDSARLGNLLRNLRAEEKSSRDDTRWLARYLGDTNFLEYPSSIGLLDIPDKKSVFYNQGGVNNKGVFEVVYFDDYQPVRFGRDHAPTRRLLSFKDGDNEVVDFYASKVLPNIRKDVILCCAPSSQNNEWGKGLLRLSGILSRSVPCVSHTNLIYRNTSTEPRHLIQGKRGEVDLDKLEIIEAERCKDKDVVVVDDIVTSGYTLCACAELLWQAQVASVSCVTMGKTIDTRGMDNVQSEPIDSD